MTIEWIKKEMEKDPSTIDWLTIAGTATQLYKEYKSPENFLGLTKGFVNIVSCSNYAHKNVEPFITSLCPDAIILKGNYQSDIVKYVNGLTVDGFKKTCTDNILIILSDKITVDTYLNRIGIPFIKFRSLIQYESISSKDSSKPFMKWKKQGSKEIKISESDILIHKRDKLL